jgi:carboxyl-terminal processing protease
MDQVKNKGLKIGLSFFALLILLSTFFAGGFIVGKITDKKITLKMDQSFYQESELSAVFQNSLLKQVWGILKEDFVDKDKIDQKKLFYGAMSGFVEGVGDPYTIFMDPEMNEDFQTQIEGEFQGIGAELGIKDKMVTVVAPLPDSPAEKAGIMPGDRIIAVDEKDTYGMSVEEVVKLIRGPKATEVKLLILRGEDDPKEYKIMRDVIKLKSVTWEMRKDGFAYIRISSFSEDTLGAFKEFVKEVKKTNPKGIIVDLRNDPGGLLDTAIEICGYWIKDGDVAVIEKYGDGREQKHFAENGAELAKFPTVVLINQGSASASEILAGALQDYGFAKLVGMTSFGKGSVQELRMLPDGSALKVTIAKWLTPKGRSINEEGIKPDVEVNFTREDAEKKIDPQLNKAVEILQGKK